MFHRLPCLACLLVTLLLVPTAALTLGCSPLNNGTVAPMGTGATTEPPAAARWTPVTPLPSREPTITAPTSTATPEALLAAIVNGQRILLADYERQLENYLDTLSEQGAEQDGMEAPNDPRRVQADLLEGMIDGVLIRQAAAAMGLSPTEEELQAQVEEEIAAGGGYAAFEEWLQATNQTRGSYADMLLQSLLSQRILEVITSDMPSEAEQVRARYIIVDKKEKAQEILTEVRQGADFALLAQESSQDLATGGVGGDQGWLARGLVAPELENALFALDPGEVSDVVRHGGGFYIIQCVARDNSRALSPELAYELKKITFDNWLAERRDAAAIERFLGE